MFAESIIQEIESALDIYAPDDVLLWERMANIKSEISRLHKVIRKAKSLAQSAQAYTNNPKEIEVWLNEIEKVTSVQHIK